MIDEKIYDKYENLVFVSNDNMKNFQNIYKNIENKKMRVIYNYIDKELVIKKSKDALFVVFSFAMFYILISALIIFNIEPESFESFFDALYWATVLLTTIGYGDILPVTVVGKIITMVSSIFGIAIVALPAGIITSGYIAILKKQRRIIRIRKGRRKLKN